VSADRSRVVVIVNPAAGPSWRRRSPEVVADRVRQLLRQLGADGDVKLTRAAGHATELAREAVAGGAELVVAWGGDGTINEVAAGLFHGPSSLGIVPMGSGNGLAREIGAPASHRRALAAALRGADRIIDAGSLNGRVFFNAAGLGFDGHVADVFARSAGRTRGFLSYASIVARELFAYRAGAYQVSAEGKPVCTCRALLISIANTRQWGSGARIAPAALMDDERLDLVMVPAVPPVVLLAHAWRLFAGSVPGWSGVTTRRIHAATIRCDPPAPAHVDGEPIGLLETATIQVIPAALRVRAPRLR
jgi:YegS/Rv2252/BmrU family lipid kinase